MKEKQQILEKLHQQMGATSHVAEGEARAWQRFVDRIPVGTRVFREDHIKDIRTTEDGRYYDDAIDRYIKVSEGGLWLVEDVKKA